MAMPLEQFQINSTPRPHTMKSSIALVAALAIASLHPSARAQWESVGSGITSTQRSIFNISAVDEDVVWAIAIRQNTFVAYDFCRTSNGGTDWIAGLLPDTIGSYYPVHIEALSAQTAWITMVHLPEQDRARLFKTDNGGLDWHERTGAFSAPGISFTAVHFFTADEAIAFGSPGTGDPSVDSLRIFRTVDGGEAWTRIPVHQLPQPLTGEGVWVHGANSYESKGDTLWFVTRASRVFRTTDRGATWSAFDAGISGNGNYPGLASIAFEDHLRGITTTALPSQAARTTDGGGTWTPITIPSTPRAGDIEHIPGTEGTYIVHQDWFDGSFTSNTYLHTRNSGDTWDTLTFTPAIKVVKFLSPTVGFGGGKVNTSDNGGVYRWTGDFMTGMQDHISKAEVHIYPNPVADQLTISLPNDQPLSAALSLELLNGPGQVVQRVPLRSSTTIIPMADLPRGLYHCRLRNGPVVQSAGRVVKE